MKIDEMNIAGGFGALARHSMAHVIARGLGIHPTLVHAFVAARHGRKMAQQRTTKAIARKPKLKSVAPNLKSINKFQPLEMHDLFHGSPSEHEHHLAQALNHHNIGTFAKSKGEHSNAEIHFRARDRYFKSYVNKAPHERLLKINQETVRRHFG